MNPIIEKIKKNAEARENGKWLHEEETSVPEVNEKDTIIKQIAEQLKIVAKAGKLKEFIQLEINESKNKKQTSKLLEEALTTLSQK